MRFLSCFKIVFTVCFIGVFSFSSLAQGIQFEQQLSWQQILKKAKKENKKVFVDCYATWCGPCKAMDKQVFSLKNVGDYYNKNFICVRMQMDTTTADDSNVKKRYPDAAMINTQYAIRAFPTMLYFSPSGKLIHRVVGFRFDDEVLYEGAKGIDQHIQYDSLLAIYTIDKNKVSGDNKMFLAYYAEGIREKKRATAIAEAYIESLPTDSLLTKNNLQFIAHFSKQPSRKGFDVLLNHAPEVNAANNYPGLAQGLVGDIIGAEETMLTNFNKEPDWALLHSELEKKYPDSIADQALLTFKFRYYKYFRNDWEKYGVAKAEFMEKYGKHSGGYKDRNAHAWEIFEHCKDTNTIKAAISWIEPEVVNATEFEDYKIDTYANLLYKLGRKEEAIQWEEKILTEAAKIPNYNKSVFDDFQKTLNKMKKGEPTWN